MTTGREAVLRAKVSMYEKWLREHVPDCPLLVENIVSDIATGASPVREGSPDGG